MSQTIVYGWKMSSEKLGYSYALDRSALFAYGVFWVTPVRVE